MSRAEWIKKWLNQAPTLPEPAVNRALLVLAGKEKASSYTGANLKETRR